MKAFQVLVTRTISMFSIIFLKAAQGEKES